MFVFIISLAVYLTNATPKKYVSTQILINKGASTNITELNPFIRSDLVPSGGGR